MSEFKLGPDLMNEALDAAGITDLRVERSLDGGLHLEVGEKSYDEILSELMGAVMLLYSRLRAAEGTP